MLPNRGATRGQAFEHLEAGHDGHADVGKHEIGHRLQDRREAFAAVIGDPHVVAALDELLGDQAGGLAVVFDDEDFFAAI